MIGALLSPRVLLGLAVVVALGAAYIKGRSDGAAPAAAKLERERAAWANERTAAAQRHAQALESEIRAHNALRNELDAIHANAQADRAVAAAQAASAAAALAAAARGSSRLRDAIETNRLATRAALDAAGAAGVCAASEAAADLLRGVLGRIDATAGRIGEAAAGIGVFADEQTAAARQCAASADAMIRASALQSGERAPNRSD